MGNCIIKELKAIVDNPNLPIIEKMQQFTIEAIAASGNNLMTDAQKYALNHFFYQIGVFNEGSTIFSKVEHLFIPFICGDIISKAFVDYKDNTNLFSNIMTSAYFEFVNHGIHAHTDTPIAFLQINGETCDWNDKSVFLLNTEEVSDSGIYTKFGLEYHKDNTDTRNIKVIHTTNFHEIRFYSNYNTQFTSPIGVKANENINTKLLGISSTTDKDYKLYNDEIIEGTHTAVAAGAESYSLWPYTMQYQGKIETSLAPLGFLFIGKYLTPSEIETLNTAVRTLKSAF